MPVTSMRIPRADAGAPHAPSMNGFRRRPTWTAAVVIPIIEAEIDRGSMSDETQECNNDAKTNDEDARKRVVDRKQGRIPAQPYRRTHSAILGSIIVISLVTMTRL